MSRSLCIESLGGVFQVVIQWLLFTTTLLLFLVYFPVHLKYADLHTDPAHGNSLISRDTTAEWKLANTLAVIVAAHVAFSSFTTFMLIATNSSLGLWTTFLGLTSAAFSAAQYLPQLQKTWNLKLVGSLSITTMCIQSPGAVLMCISIAIRPGTNWTSWITYAAAGALQACLLVMCLFWKRRQWRLNIDDFGRPLFYEINQHLIDHESNDESHDENMPLLGPESPRSL